MPINYSKPVVRNAWADTAVPTTDIIDPGNAFVTAGWLQSNTPPARQYFNWALNWAAAGVRYFMQRGVSAWDSAETYQQSCIVNWNGTLFESLQNNNTGNSPQANFAGTWWGPLSSYGYYVPVSTGGNYNLFNYVLSTTLTSTLASYVTTTSLTSTLSNYVTNASLTTTLSSYLTTASAAATYVSNSSLATTLASYLTTAAANTTYAKLISPGFSGVPTAPTAASGTATTQLATTLFATGTWGNTTSNGYQKFPNGNIFQWGLAVNSTGGPVAIPFPVAFPNACVSITATSSPNNGTINVSNPNSSNTGFTLTNGAAGQNTCWMAIGY
jgi:hypothetical protein